MNYFSWRYGGRAAPALDESLAEHDKKYHPNGFDPERETCNKRTELAKADKGDVLSPSEGAEKVGDKPLVSAAEDATYMDAVRRGDMETAAKMVREVAGMAFPNTKVVDEDGLPKVVYHGGNFRKYYTVPDLKPGEMHFGTLAAAKERVKYKYQGMEDSVSIDGYFLNLENPKRTEDLWGHSLWLDWSDEEDRKHDGVVYKNESEDEGNDSYGVSWDPSRIKSADPVTYDDDGNVIPLSRRFDGGDDIRGDVSGGGYKKG